MPFLQSKSSQKRALLLLKWVVFSGNIIYLYFAFGKDDSFSRLYNELTDIVLRRKISGFLVLALLLVFANWGLEAYKWKTLVNKFQPITFKRCYAAILAGSAVSLWIPNRAGEYLGRVLFVRPGSRIKGILATIVGSMAQLCVTLVLGVCGAFFYAYNNVPKNAFWTVLPALSILLMSLLLFFYFNINKIRYLFPRTGLLGKIRRFMVIYTFYSFTDLAKVLFIAALRYFVFSFQFILLLWFFGADIPLVHGWLSVSVIYLVQTIAPSTALTELGVRGAASVFFLENYTSNTTAILFASYAIWLINLLLPAIIGLFVVMFFRLKNKSRAKA